MDPDIRPFPARLVSLDARRLVPGAIGGLLAGLLFGAIMHATGLMTLVATAIGTTSLLAAWGTHLLVSVIFGVAFASLADVESLGGGVTWGLAWGVALWAVATMVFLRGLLGHAAALDRPAILSLGGHLVYGAVLGTVYTLLRMRATPESERAARSYGS